MLFSAARPMKNRLSSLDKPFSADQHGNLVTMREYIAAYGHPKVREAVGNPVADPARTIKTANTLTEDDLFKLAEVFTLEEDDTILAYIGRPSLTKQQRLESVRQRTAYGHECIDLIRNNMRMVEGAIRGGWIEFIEMSAELELPPL